MDIKIYLVVEWMPEMDIKIYLQGDMGRSVVVKWIHEWI